jgi:hypothetical protein
MLSKGYYEGEYEYMQRSGRRRGERNWFVKKQGITMGALSYNVD